MIQIQLSSNVPIYEQIVEQLKWQITDGTLAAGVALPSIRALAKELKISVITTKRAYAELEQLGLIETIPGKGSFVANSSNAVQEQAAKQIELHIEQAVQLSKQLKYSREEMDQLLDLFWGDDE